MARLYGPRCEAGNCYCTLARGVRYSDLFGGDGPFDPISPAERLTLDNPANSVYSDTQATEETD